MISSYRDKMNIQIVNFFGINRVMTHNSSQSLPVDWGWDIVSFTNSMEPLNSSKSERTQWFKSVHLHASCRNGLSRPTRKELLILQAVCIEQKYKENLAKTEWYKRSSIPSMQRLLNKHEKKLNGIFKSLVPCTNNNWEKIVEKI